MSGLALVGHQFRYDQKAFWRNPASVFFTVMFPVLLLLIFAVVFGWTTVARPRRASRPTTYYVPAIITLSIISATMQTLAMSLVIAREDGRLKRGRGTPMPPWVFIAGRIGNSIVVALMMLVLLAAIGAPPLRRRLPLGPAAGDPARAGRRRRLLLLPRHRAHRGDPVPGRRGPDRQRRCCCRSTSSPASSSPTTSCRAGSSTSPTSSRSATSSTPSSTPTCPAAAARSPGTTSRWSRSGASAGLLLAIRFFRWTPRSAVRRRPTFRRPRL